VRDSSGLEGAKERPELRFFADFAFLAANFLLRLICKAPDKRPAAHFQLPKNIFSRSLR
jgi:hypothetical protein